MSPDLGLSAVRLEGSLFGYFCSGPLLKYSQLMLNIVHESLHRG